MKISAVIENTSTKGLPVEHGLSLWVEACGRRFFFDLGQGSLFASNAKAMGIEVNDADFAIVSHGHYDHGGGIATFLEQNDHAPVYLHRDAFTHCFSEKDGRLRYIGIDQELRGNERLRPTDGVVQIAEGLTLFSGCKGHRFFSPANGRILKRVDGATVCDDFVHEQSLIVEEGQRRVLIAGCAHSGILNIMARAEEIIGAHITDVVSGMHLKGVEDIGFIDSFANGMMEKKCRYYTFHCTGEDAFRQLKATMGEKIEYVGCGDDIKF